MVPGNRVNQVTRAQFAELCVIFQPNLECAANGGALDLLGVLQVKIQSAVAVPTSRASAGALHISAIFLNCRLPSLSRADADDFVRGSNEYFPVTKFAGAGSLLDGLDDQILNVF